jgi:hypothetical protein
MSSTSTEEASGFPTPRQERLILIALFVYFAARLVFYAVSITPGVPPDEVTHFNLCRIFSKTLFLPVNSPETYPYGLVTNIPWLYYWLMGKLLWLNVFGLPEVTFLRLCNVPMALGTAYFTWRTATLLTGERLARILALVFITNIAMFSLLSAGVSYDNLTNLLAAMAIYFLLAFFKERNGTLLALSLLCQLAGCLTKNSLLPLVLVLNVLLVVNEARNLPRLAAGFTSWLRGSGARGVVIMVALLAALALNLQLYGGNYLRYHNISPDMADVLSADSAMKYRTQARNMIFMLYKEGKVSKEKALEMTSVIANKVDRGTTAALIEDYDYQKSNGMQLMNPVQYIPLWAETVCAGTFGIFAHLPMQIGPLKIYLFLALLVLAGIGFLRRWRPSEEGWLPAYLAVVAVFYCVFLMYFVNYRTYLDYWSPWLSLQGRYIFPVLAPISVLSALYLVRLPGGRGGRLAVFAACALLFILSDFPFFLSNVTPDWFAWPRG